MVDTDPSRISRWKLTYRRWRGSETKHGQAGRFGDAISAEVNRGRALGYYVERRESGAVGAFQAKTREEADKQLEETIARIAAKQAIEKAKQGQS